jgi:hypothetical protein
MNDAVQPGRRRFLRDGVGLTVAVVSGTPAAAFATPTMARLVRNSFSDPAAAIAVGRTYLASRPQPTDVPRLASELIAAEPRWRGVLSAGSTTELRRFAAAQCRIDFATDRVATLDGWVLGFTELRLCALAALA